MSTNSYQLYLESTRRLARTIVLKSEITATLMNNWMVKQHGALSVNTEDPTTWRYYRHVSGEYHPVDTPMIVKSWDNMDDIVFSKENLAIHRATARAYAFGTKQFEELVAQYPRQDLLILGILYPAEINYAISAPDGSVLAYPPELIEENEYGLIHRIEHFVQGFLKRWFNIQYVISDNLYAASALAILYLNLYPAILNYRLEACKTAEVHSFHINQYLLSYGVPEAVLPHLTKKQALFLYRNIKYIRIHAGKDDVFRWLVENLFTERYLPLSEYTMRHFDDDLLNTLYPTVRFKNKPINTILGETHGDVITLQSLLAKESALTSGNPEYIGDNLPTISRMFETTGSNVVQTNVLESAVTDYTNAVLANLDTIYLNYWPYLAKLGIYQAYIGFTNARTGEQMMLTAGDAYLLMLYVGARALGYEIIEVPPAACERVFRYPMPSMAELNAITTSLTETEFERIQAVIPANTDIVSVDAFNRFCRQVQKSELTFKMLIATQQAHFRRAEMKAAVYRHFTDSFYHLAEPNEPYATWLSERNLNLDHYTQTDFAMLYSEIFTAGTGKDLEVSPSLIEIQKAMSTLLLNLSSYSIKLIRQVNDSDIIDPQMPAVRINNDGLDMAILVDIPLQMAGVVAITAGQDYLMDTVNAKPKMAWEVHAGFSVGGYIQTAVRVNSDIDAAIVYDFDLTHRTTHITHSEIIEN